jgi:L,D-peptidoglycan transpeptidase YkuD (ErfK/YbiS/YcfS/YnhG family)
MTGLGVLLVAGMLAVGAPAMAPDTPTGSRTTTTTRITLGGVSVALPTGSSQVVTVNHTHGWRARVALWQRAADGWHRLARTRSGRTGYGGLVRPRLREQGTGTTPLGTFRLLSAFGTHDQQADWDLGYRLVGRGDYWVEDNRSAYYNRYRNRAEGGFRWWLPQSNVNASERLTDFPVEYEYSIVTSFNYYAQVRHRGAGIFLHVNGRGATAGCVSAARWFLQRTMATLDPDLRPVIAIG